MRLLRKPGMSLVAACVIIVLILFMSRSSRLESSQLESLKAKTAAAAAGNPVGHPAPPADPNKEDIIQAKLQAKPQSAQAEPQSDPDEVSQSLAPQSEPQLTSNLQLEKPIMPKMENETLKAELGRATWKLFHTILARYSDEPTDHERQTLSNYITLFSQVYPCGDCAQHFQEMLQKYPPQLTNRYTASNWGCYVHNIVNKRLGKEEYDCSAVIDNYDCGCGPGGPVDETVGGITLESKEDLTRGG